MGPRVAIITGADSNYYSLLDDLLSSLRGQSYGDLFVLDMGLDEDQLDALSYRHDTAEFVSIPYKDNPQLVQSNLYKTKLPELVSGYDVYVWVDADIWFQDVSALADLIALSPEDMISLVPEVHPSYDFHENYVAWREATYGAMFKPKVSDALLKTTTLNAGLFAMRPSSPLWQAWGHLLAKLVGPGPRTTISDQGVLNYLLHMREVQYKALPAVNNWMTHLALPVWEPAKQALCTPDEARTVIRAIHLAANSKDKVFDFELGATRLRSSFRYSDVERFFKNAISEGGG
ncbi:hypothetical protein JYU02_00795 [bacterium AH-315-P15]|nr:hypothetical protein [bacterium AH-315-P15]